MVAERVRERVESHFRRSRGPKVTLSAGVALWPDDALTADDLVRRADQGLYRAKALGKNQVARARTGSPRTGRRVKPAARSGQGAVSARSRRRPQPEAMLAFLLALALQDPPAVPQGPADAAAEAREAPPVVLREIAFEGASAYSRATLLEAIRLKTGEPLKPRPESVARVLETYYHLEGYRAARVSAAFEAAACSPCGWTKDASRDSPWRAFPPTRPSPPARALGLEVGRVLREADLWEALVAAAGGLGRGDPAGGCRRPTPWRPRKPARV